MTNNQLLSMTANAGNSKNWDINVRNQILLENMGLIMTLAKKVSSSQEEQKNLVVNGCIRFLEIFNDYDPKKGKLSTYMWNPLLQSMYESIRGYNKTLGLFLRSYENAVECLSERLNRKPSENEIAEFMGISIKILRKRLLSLKNRLNINFDEPVSAEDSESASLLDFYVSDNYEDASTAVLKKDDRHSIRLAWARLTDSERKILALRPYENGNRISLREAAKIAGVSKETIRNKENMAKQHFSELLSEYGVFAA